MAKKNRAVVTIDVQDSLDDLMEIEAANPQLARHAIARVAVAAGVALLRSDPTAIRKYWGASQRALLKLA